MKIYVNFKKPKTLREFFTKFYQWNRIIGDWQRGKAVSTFFDKKCTQLQCSMGRSRSSIDLYDITTTYFPKATLNDMMDALLTSCPKNYFWYPSWCCTVRRHVMSYLTHANWQEFPRKSVDMSWGTLLRNLGIANKQQMNDYKYK